MIQRVVVYSMSISLKLPNRIVFATQDKCECSVLTFEHTLCPYATRSVHILEVLFGIGIRSVRCMACFHRRENSRRWTDCRLKPEGGRPVLLHKPACGPTDLDYDAVRLQFFLPRILVVW